VTGGRSYGAGSSLEDDAMGEGTACGAQRAGLALMAYGLLRRVAATVPSESTAAPRLLVQPGVGTFDGRALTVIGRF